MKIKSVEFSDDDKKFIRLFIVSNALSEDSVYDREGYEFEFTKDNLPFLGEMSLFVTVSLWDEYLLEEPPNSPMLLSRDVLKLKYMLCQDGEEVATNLDFEFEEEVKQQLINTK